MGQIQSHKDLIAWQKAVALATTVYAATRLLPTDERWGLVSQMRRAAISIPSNIAEGAARKNRAEFLQFLYVSRASLAELETQMMIALEQRFLSTDQSGLERIAEVGRILNGLISKLASAHREAHASACAPHARKASGAAPN
jgi:four helix bundle protein